MLQAYIPGFSELFLLNNLVFEGEVWRYVSSIFLHGGLSHLIYNLFALLLFGFILESMIGSKRFLLVFFCSGIFANIIGIHFYDSSLGASGAIYGIIGCVSIIKPFMMVWAFGLIMPISVAAVLWVIGDLIGLFVPSNVGHIAHLSGMFIGLVIGFFFKKAPKKKKKKVFISEDYINSWEKSFMR